VAYIISAFSLVASAFAIAAILIVSVLRKAKQIGILKSMGARRAQIRRIFVLEGLGIAILGSTSGAAIAIALLRLLMLIEQPIRYAGEKPQSLFPIVILPLYVAVAMIAAILTTVFAAWLPARNAANLNPVEVMR
jgi:lipoprotein-releasing system permease protein